MGDQGQEGTGPKAKRDTVWRRQKWDALPSSEKAACKDQAEAAYDAAVAQAERSKEQKDGVAERVRQ